MAIAIEKLLIRWPPLLAAGTELLAFAIFVDSVKHHLLLGLPGQHQMGQVGELALA